MAPREIYGYYIVENAYPARVDGDSLDAETLAADGAGVPEDNVEKIVNEGREVSEADALGFWAENPL